MEASSFFRMRFVAGLAALALTYFFAARFGLSLAFATEQVTTVWPPTGIALAAVLLFGRRVWPGIFVGAFFANLFTNEPPLVALGIAGGNTLEAVFGAYLINRFSVFRRTFDELRDVVVFIGCAVLLGTMVSATIGVTTLVVGGLAESNNFWSIWLTWWVGDAMGALIVAPFLLVWTDREERQKIFQSPFEAFALFSLTMIASAMVFLGEASRGMLFYALPLIYIVFPFFIYAAIRLNHIGSITTVFIVAATAIVGTVRGQGPFATGAPVEFDLLLLQMFLFVSTTSVLMLASAIAERKKLTENIRRSEQRFRALIEHSSDAVALIDVKGIIRYASPSTKRVIGYAPDEFTGTQASTFIHPDDLPRMERMARSLVGADAGRTVSMQFRGKHKDQSWRWFEGVGTNLLHDRSVNAIVANYRDITERRRIEDAKAEFVSLASHQLRTPLATMKWYLDILVHRQVRKKFKPYMKRVVSANERMIDLVEDLLQISRLELGTAVGKKEKVDLRSMLSAVIEEVVPITEKKRLTIVLPPRGALPAVEADRRFARMMLLNVISNAVKYTPDGGSVRFSFHTLDRLPRSPVFRGKPKRKSRGFVVLTVEDTGWGIPKDEQEHVFTKFFRGRNIAVRDQRGTGLGLHLVELLAAYSDGGVWFESDEGKGTSFHVAFPAHPSARKR